LWIALELSNDDLLAMQDGCLRVLKTAPVIAGCCGARKMRFVPIKSNVGKSGALRVIFKFFEKYHKVVMGAVYPKSVKENISTGEKKALCQYFAEIEADLSLFHGE
jgi:hypothetical protein